MIQIKNKIKAVVIIALALAVIASAIVAVKKNKRSGENIIQPGVIDGVGVLSVDASNKLGEMPYLYRSGIWKQDNGQDFRYITGKFFQENVVGKAQLEIGNELSQSKSFEDFKKNIIEKYEEGSNSGDIVKKAKNAGQTLIIGQWPGKIPEWLSSRAGDTGRYSASGFAISSSSPSKCYGYKCTSMKEITCYTDECRKVTKEQLAKDGYVIGWAGVVDYTIKYFRNNLGVQNLGYYFGHEQNKDWIGSEEEFYKMYEATAKTIKAVDKNILVGGTGPWDSDSPRIKCGPPHYNEIGTSICNNIPGWSIDGKYEPMNKNFISYAKKHNLPIDFVNWHSFALPPSLFSRQAERVRGWLKENGFSEDTPLYPADWTVFGSGYPADYIDTEYNPAYIATALFNMDKAGIQWHGHDFDVGGNREAEKGVNAVVKQRGISAQFIGTWATFTPEQIIKPSYNAFRLTSLLYGKQENAVSNRIEAGVSDEFITAVASQTKDKAKTRILASNLIPSGDILNGHLFNRFQELPSMQATKEYKEKILSCAKDNKDGETKEQTTQCMNKITNNIKDQTMRERVNAQTQLYVCFKSSSDKAECIQDIYNKTPDQQTKIDIETIKKEYQNILENQKTPRKVALNMTNLPFSGKATLTTYIIDKDHSNSCRYNKRTEEKPTDTECGVNGAVDKAVMQAKKEAREKSLPTAMDYLKQQKYTDSQLTVLKNQVITPCLAEDNLLACIQPKLTASCQKDKTLNCDKLTQDLQDAYQKYQEVYKELFYYGKYNNPTNSIWIDKINNDPNISIEGSKKIEQITITNGTYKSTLITQPNSVMLVEVEK